MKVTMNISEHMVEARETIKTEGGEFDCLKVSYVANTKVSIVKSQSKIISWYADGIGVVKQENYDKKGKLVSTMVLTKVEK